MYSDTKPCQVCGSPVDLKPRMQNDPRRVAAPDGTADERICSNPDCATNRPGSEQQP